MNQKATEAALVSAVSAAVHYQEYIDTDEPFDLIAAQAAMQGLSLKDWARKNAAMLPDRRDGKSFLESIE